MNLGLIPHPTPSLIIPAGFYTWTDTDQRSAGGGSISLVDFTNFDIGTPQSDRHVAVALGVQGISSGTASVTVNGVAATQTVFVQDTSTGIQEHVGVYIAAVPTDQLVTVRVSFSVASDKGVLVNAYSLYGFNATAHHTITDNNSDPATGSLNTTAGAVAIGSVFIRSNDASGSFTWTGLTEDGFDWYVSGSQGGSSASALGSGSAISVSADFNGTPFRQPVMAAASYPLA
jgi:hypothetical protein